VKGNMNWIDCIKTYIPCNEQEKKDKDIILFCIEKFDDILTRENEIAHITSSAFVVNGERNKVLMVHHNIYNSWSWTGGHADGDENLLEVATREVNEETGVSNIHPVCSEIFSLDILTVLGHVKRGKYVSPHLHLSVSYLLEGDEKEQLIVKEDENSGVKWVPIDEVNIYSNEPHMQKVYEKLICKVKEIGKCKLY
jgi:8-oxo-dGTP pyrophosphatase MutT (NUDIX family)